MLDKRGKEDEGKGVKDKREEGKIKEGRGKKGKKDLNKQLLK